MNHGSQKSDFKQVESQLTINIKHNSVLSVNSKTSKKVPFSIRKTLEGFLLFANWSTKSHRPRSISYSRPNQFQFRTRVANLLTRQRHTKSSSSTCTSNRRQFSHTTFPRWNWGVYQVSSNWLQMQCLDSTLHFFFHSTYVIQKCIPMFSFQWAFAILGLLTNWKQSKNFNIVRNFYYMLFFQSQHQWSCIVKQLLYIKFKDCYSKLL